MRLLRRRGFEVALLAGLALLLAAAVLYVVPSDDYVFLPDVAHPVAPLVRVPAKAAKPAGEKGGIYFVDVIIRKASLLERIWPGHLHDGAAIYPASAVVPPGGSESQRQKLGRQEMSRSQKIASAVALRALGRKVTARPRGVLVDAVDPKAPAAGEVRPGDRIVAVDGEQALTTTKLRRLVSARKPGARIRLSLVAAGGGRRTVAVRTVGAHGRTLIGIVVEQAVDVRLPIDVRIDAGDVGGPSAGLAFALDLMEKLGRDVDRGRRIAATGELALDGSVRPVGGLEQKTIGARRAHVDLFLVPAGENAEVARRYADGLRIVPVKSFRQALSKLATTPATG